MNPFSTTMSTLPHSSYMSTHDVNSSFGTAELAAWYMNYSSLINPMALSFWPSFGVDPALLKMSEYNSEYAESITHDNILSNDLCSITASISAQDREESDSPASTTSMASNVKVSPSQCVSRRSLKPEHHYFLMNPETSYVALSTLYPRVSVQCYSRWKHKVMFCSVVIACYVMIFPDILHIMLPCRYFCTA